MPSIGWQRHEPDGWAPAGPPGSHGWSAWQPHHQPSSHQQPSPCDGYAQQWHTPPWQPEEHFAQQQRQPVRPGLLRVRVGGMPDLPADEMEAYVLVGFGQKHPPTASMPLPPEDSALLHSSRWQQRLFEYRTPPRDDEASGAHLRNKTEMVVVEAMAWRPGAGECSLGKLIVNPLHVAELGRTSMRGPYGLVVQLDYLPPPPPPGELDADKFLAGSGVRRVMTAADSEDSSPWRSRHSRLWRPEGREPTPSAPISVCGVPPRTPPGVGMRWVWGATQWHQVPAEPDHEEPAAASRADFLDHVASPRGVHTVQRTPLARGRDRRVTQ